MSDLSKLQDIGRPSSSSGKAREASHDFASNPRFYSTPETQLQQQDQQLLQQLGQQGQHMDTKQFEQQMRHHAENHLRQYEHNMRQGLQQYEHNMRQQLLERLGPHIMQMSSKQLEHHMRQKMDQLQEQPLPMRRDIRAEARPSQDAERQRGLRIVQTVLPETLDEIITSHPRTPVGDAAQR